MIKQYPFFISWALFFEVKLALLLGNTLTNGKEKYMLWVSSKKIFCNNKNSLLKQVDNTPRLAAGIMVINFLIVKTYEIHLRVK
jgi:hypothetical protein